MLLGLASSVFWFPIQEAEAAGWLAGYNTRRKLTINQLKVDSDLTNFPVLVKLTSANFDFTKANANGHDIRFTAADGVTLLSYERERHDSVGLRAEYWVRIPAVSGTVNTEFYIYYRTAETADGATPTAVWDVNTVASWRLKELGTGAVGEYKDSTINANHGRGGGGTVGAVPTRVEGKIAEAQSFDGVDDRIGLGTGTTLNFGSGQGFTFEAWVRTTDAQGMIVSFRDDSVVGHPVIDLGIGVNSASPANPGHFMPLMRYNGGTGHAFFSSTQNIANGVWHHIVFVYDPAVNQIRAHVNGIGFTETQTVIGSITTNLRYLGEERHWVINGFGTPDQRRLNGIIDEVRISNIARSAAWVRASFHSGNNTLLTYGVEEVPISDPIGTCFIATAAYGTPTAEEVEVLRKFRDQYLLTNELGQRFVSLYYRRSPALAEYISDRKWAKRVVRITLSPLVRIAEFMVRE
jgi:hypothetical protein